jgi:hypothetical protein
MGMPSGAGISEVLKVDHPALPPSKSAEFVAREYCEQFPFPCPARIQIYSQRNHETALVWLVFVRVAEEQALMSSPDLDVE